MNAFTHAFVVRPVLHGVGKSRVTKTDDNILMLRRNMTSGHFGKSGRFAALEDAARSYAFALKALGRASFEVA